MRVARPVVLKPDQQEALETRARARSAPARSVERAQIVLLAGAGWQDREIALRLKITPEKAARWRNRFLDGGLSALDKDAPRPGRTPTITPTKVQDVVRMTSGFCLKFGAVLDLPEAALGVGEPGATQSRRGRTSAA